MKKKLFSMVLTLLLVVSLFPAVGNTAQATDETTAITPVEEFAGGDGLSEETAFKIETPAQLAMIAYKVNHCNEEPVKEGESVTYATAFYKLTNDIVLNDTTNWVNWATEAPGSTWKAIGAMGSSFKGTFDGNSYTVSGIYISSTDHYQGLFGYVQDGIIKNVLVKESYIKGQNSVGGIVGCSSNNSIENCSNFGSIRGKKYIGGIVGCLTSSGESTTTVQDCYNAGIVSSTIATCTECDIGGIVGCLTSSGESTTIVQKCYNAGYISAGAGTTMGGIAGKIGSTNCTVEKCCNSGNICGNSVRGNIAGTNNGTITECYYDKQMDFRPDKGIYPAKDEIGKYEGKLTTKMLGDELENILGTENWRYAEGMYPRLKNVADTDTATVYATPIFLNENDTTNLITKDFTVSTQNGVVWTSDRPGYISISDENATVLKSGNVISQALIATLNGVTKTVWVWKTENVTPLYYMGPTAHSEIIHGVHTEIHYPNGRYFHHGDKVTVQIKISTDGTITKTGTFVLDFHIQDGEIQFTGQKHIELPVVKGETLEDKTYEYTFTMPDQNVNLYYDRDFNLPKYETPIFVSNTVAKTSKEQTAVTFTLTKDFGTECEWYPVKLDEEGYVQLDDRIQVRVDSVNLTIASANGEAIQPCDYQIVVMDEENEDLDFSELVTLTVGPSVETPPPVVSTGTSKRTSRGTDIIVNGKKKPVGDVKTETHNGKKTTTVTVDGEKLNYVLEEEQNGATVVIPIKSNSDVATGSLNGQMVKDMEANEATLEIETKSANYTLPTSEIDIDQISQQYGESVALSDIDIEITIAEPSDETVTVVENAAETGDFSIVCPAVDFSINCSYKGKTTPVRNFNSYVQRMVAVPAGVDPNKITTGIVVHPDGTTHHVPTHVTIIDGIYYAKINSLTNSTYTVVYNPVEFSDVTGHWAKEAINDMGSRMVVSGIGNNQYEPDRSMTRAEFTAILVRAMGLDTGLGHEAFPDVNEDDWYCGSVDTGVSYDLIKGYHNGNFGPDDKITREQAMAMIVRAMKKTGLKVELSEDEVTELLSPYSDALTVSAYARTSIATCIKTGIIQGTGTGVLTPKEKISRAEVAVMVQRLLQKSALI